MLTNVNKFELPHLLYPYVKHYLVECKEIQIKTFCLRCPFYGRQCLRFPFYGRQFGNISFYSPFFLVLSRVATFGPVQNITFFPNSTFNSITYSGCLKDNWTTQNMRSLQIVTIYRNYNDITKWNIAHMNLN